MLKTEQSKQQLKIQNMAISDVQTKGSWYYIIDSSGKKSATLAASTGDLMGIGMDFIVLQKGSYYYTHDEKAKRIGTLSVSSGDFKNAAGNSFNLKKGSYIYTFDKKCKRTGTRSA